MIHSIHSSYAASISDFKKNPMHTIEQGHGEPVAILNRNQPVFYCIPTDTFEKMLEQIDNQLLIETIQQRSHESEIKVSIHDL